MNEEETGRELLPMDMNEFDTGRVVTDCNSNESLIFGFVAIGADDEVVVARRIQVAHAYVETINAPIAHR